MIEYKDTQTGEPFDPASLPIQVCFSNAGWYIGQLEPCGVPFSRLSGYYKTHGGAESDLKAGWPARDAIENKPLEASLKAAGVIVEIDGGYRHG